MATRDRRGRSSYGRKYARRSETLCREMKEMCRVRLAQKAVGDESWWDAMEGEMVGEGNDQAPEAEKFVRQSQAEKGLEWVGD